jgi:malic enzyme
VPHQVTREHPNHVNNSCCFPGFFRGMLDVRARSVNDEMKLATAHALAAIVGDAERSEEHITPSMFGPRVVPTVAAAVADAAVLSGAGPEDPPQVAHGSFLRHGAENWRRASSSRRAPAIRVAGLSPFP